MALYAQDPSTFHQTDPETEHLRKLWVRVYEMAVEDACSQNPDPWGKQWARWFLTSGCYDFRQLCHRLNYDAEEHLTAHRERWGTVDDKRIAGEVWREMDKEFAIVKREQGKKKYFKQKLEQRKQIETSRPHQEDSVQ